MKTSFYFVLWIGAYLLINLLNIPFLNSSPFAAACVIVYLGSILANKIFSDSVNCKQNNDLTRKFEQVYTEDRKAFLKDARINIIESSVLSIYFILSIIGMWLFELESLFCYIVFGVLTILYLSRLLLSINNYNKIKECNTLQDMIDENLKETYAEFSSYRALEDSAEFMYMKHQNHSFKVISIIASILSILIGLFFLVSYSQYLFDGNVAIIVSSLVIYGGLALVYGVKDLIECIKIHI